MDYIRVILPASLIPLNCEVTKRTGEKVYILRDKLRVFNGEGDPQEIPCRDGSRFIVANGDANVVNADTELVWLADFHMLEEMLHILSLEGGDPND